MVSSEQSTGTQAFMMNGGCWNNSMITEPPMPKQNSTADFYNLGMVYRVETTDFPPETQESQHVLA